MTAKKCKPLPKIENLTPEQDAKLEEYFIRWCKIGLSTEPADRPRAEDALRRVYAVEKLAPPRIIWCESPFSAVDLLRQEKRAPSWIYGQHDGYWLGFYEYMREVVGLVEETDELVPMMDFARACGWASVYEDTAFLCERTSRLIFDDHNNLHCEDGPALSYPDGKHLYAWHGVIVPARAVLEKEKLSIAEIRSEQNVEVRRALRGLLGEARYLRETGAKVIDADMEGVRLGAAPRALLQDDEGRRFVAWTDGGTGRVYYNEVPQTVKTCKEAHEALCGFDEARILAKS